MAQPEAQPVRVLLVEDNPADVRMIREALAVSRIPHELHVVEDGEKALDFVRRRPPYAEAPAPDLMLVDSLTRFLDARGAWPFSEEGATYFALSEGALLRQFGPYVTESMRAFLRLEMNEQRRPSLRDAELAVSLNDLSDRLLVADSVAARFRGTLAFQQMDWRRGAYLWLLVSGTEEAPAFGEDGTLRPAFREALERFVSRAGNTASGRMARDYLALLRASEFKDAPAVADFRRRIRDAAGPRG